MKGQVHTAQRHDSALQHVTGQALYIDDIAEPPGTLHAALVLSPIASGRLRKLDLSMAASSPGVVAVFAAGDIPGLNNIASPGKQEPLFAEDKVEHAGQPLAMVVAHSLDAARAAAERAKLDIEPTEAIARLERRIHKVPFQDYVNLQRIIGSVDFNLMPLQSNVFTDCKSELKYFDAAIVGTVSIASPSHTYRAIIDHGANGYISKAHEWKGVIADAILKFHDYAEMAARARAVAQERFAWSTQRKSIMKALNA